jgi:hypothetical protein
MKPLERIADRLPERLRPGRKSAAAAPPEPPAGARPELVQRKDKLAADVAQLQFDLGGLAYEMAIRDHFRLDVLVRRAAVLQERDAELAELERQVRLEDAGAAGACRSCGALHARGAAFCWKCGATLLEQASPSALAGGERTNGHVKALATPQPEQSQTTHGGLDESS